MADNVDKPAPDASAAAVADVSADTKTTEAAAPAPAPAAVSAEAAAADAAAPETTATAPETTAPDPAKDAEAVTVDVPNWPALAPSHPLLALHARLPAVLAAAGHDKIWGITLAATAPPTFGTLLVLQKYLRSVGGADLDLAAANLEATLKWRKEFGLDQDQSADAKLATPEAQKVFSGLGYVTEVTREGRREVVTWNVYGAVKDFTATFGDLDRFLHWRVDLMERAIARLHLNTTTIPIPDFGEGDDPHRLAQVHVYTGVSFLRLHPDVKAASKATIALMGAHYPETLSRKMFVGVPLLMSWVFTAVRMFVSAETAKKFVVVSYETNLAAELADPGDVGDVPKAYGGTGPELLELEARPEKASA